MSTQLTNFMRDLTQNGALAKQFMESQETITTTYNIPSYEALIVSARTLSDLNQVGLLQKNTDILNQLDIASELCTKTCTVNTCHHNPHC